MNNSLKLCNDCRRCFAKNERGMCRVLAETYNDSECPFCKPNRIVTNGRIYPDMERNRGFMI